jgi:hypothetical protein
MYASPILGSVESINSLSRDVINRYYRKRYRPENIVVAAAKGKAIVAKTNQTGNTYAPGGVR